MIRQEIIDAVRFHKANCVENYCGKSFVKEYNEAIKAMSEHDGAEEFSDYLSADKEVLEPAMTVEEFLAKGFKFVEGDIYFAMSSVIKIGLGGVHKDVANAHSYLDCDLRVVKAAALDADIKVNDTSINKIKGSKPCVYKGGVPLAELGSTTKADKIKCKISCGYVSTEIEFNSVSELIEYLWCVE